MKTAISIPDPLFQAADKLARESKLTRSELYRRAIAEYVKRAKDADITARINKMCETEDTSLDPFWREASVRALQRDMGPNGEW